MSKMEKKKNKETVIIFENHEFLLFQNLTKLNRLISQF